MAGVLATRGAGKGAGKDSDSVHSRQDHKMFLNGGKRLL